MGSMVPKAHKEYTVHSATMLRCGERTDLNARPITAVEGQGQARWMRRRSRPYIHLDRKVQMPTSFAL